MWFKSLRRQIALRRDLQAVRTELAQLRALLVAQHASPSQQPLENLAVAAVQSVSKNLESMAGFIGQAGELALSQTARALGSRGGKRSAAKAARRTDGRFTRRPGVRACRLCHNPSLSDPTVREIQEHAQHNGQLSLPRADVEYDYEAPPEHEAPAPRLAAAPAPNLDDMRSRDLEATPWPNGHDQHEHEHEEGS
jgi:hypothetical protein